MSDYDFVLNDLGMMGADLTEERLKLQGKNEVKGKNERQILQAKSLHSQSAMSQS